METKESARAALDDYGVTYCEKCGAELLCKRRAVVIDVPTAMLAAAQGKRVTLSMRYKVNSEISGNAVIVLWANYESGNESRRLMTLATTSQTTPAGDWTTATLNYTFKDETAIIQSR